MTATMTSFAIFFPDWNSLDSVRLVHSRLEASALVFFALLVVAETVAHLSKSERRKHFFDTAGIIFFAIAVLAEIGGYKYGERNDELSENVIRSLDQLSNDAETKANQARADSAKAVTESGQANTASGNAVTQSSKALTLADSAAKTAITAKKGADIAEKEADDIHTRLAWRHVDPKKRDAFIKRLKPFAGSVVLFDFAGESDPEAIGFAKEVLTLLHDAGWLTRDQQNSFGSRIGMECFTSVSIDSGRAFAEVMGNLPSSKITPWKETSVAARIVFGLKAPP